MHPGPNQILAAKYRLVRQLGQGGMGSVWLAEHLTLRSPVAIKLIEPSIAANPEALARFLREAQAAASLRSPHVVQILDYGVDGNVPFIAMEVLEGESLASRLERVKRLSPADTARLMNHVARAMTRAHEMGIVHRDLKPDNVYIVHNDEEELAKVLDFGVAKSNLHGLGTTASSGTRTGSVLGTPYYMSPEQAEGSKLLDQRTDIWAMGVIAYECLLGVRPFEAETLGSLLLAICAREMPVPSRAGPVPPGFDAWFARACSRDMSQRFSTAKEAVHELRRVCGDPTVAGSAGAGYGPPPAGYGAPPGTASHPSSFVAYAASNPVAPTTGQPLVATTNGLGALSTRTPGLPKTRISGGVIVGAMIGVLALGAAGALFALKTDPPASAAGGAVSAAQVAPTPSIVGDDSAAPTIAAQPAAPDPAPLAASPPPATSSEPAPAIAAAPAARPASPSPRPVTNRPASAQSRPAVAAPKPTTPPATPAPAPASPPPTSQKQPINLGI